MANDEKKEIKVLFLRIAIVVAFALLYMWGGYEFGPGKWVRRFLAPAVLACGCFGLSLDWRYLLMYPLVMVGACLGYGGTDLTWLKIVKRGYCGLMFGAGVSLPEWLRKRWIMASVGLLSCVSAFILFGVWNPFPGARVEEFVLGCVIAFIPAMSARRIA
jgi:hypothetical protein